MGDVEGHAPRPLPEAGEEIEPWRWRCSTSGSVPQYLGARTLGIEGARALTGGPFAPLRLATHEAYPEAGARGWARVKPTLRRHLRQRPVHDRRALARSTSRPSCRCRSCPATRSSGSSSDDCEDLAAGQRVVLSSVLGVRRTGRGPAVRELRGRRHRPLRPRHGRPPEARPADRLLRDDRRRVEPADARRTDPSSAPVPDDDEDETAVLIEPLACAIHAALRAEVARRRPVRGRRRRHGRASSRRSRSAFTEPGPRDRGGEHQRQRAAAKLVAGADEVVRPEHAAKAVRRRTSAVMLTPERGQEFLLGGVDVAIECTGSSSALDLALRTTKAGGRDRRLRHPRRRRRPHPACGSASSSSSGPTPRRRGPRRRGHPTHVREGDRAGRRTSRCSSDSWARPTRWTGGATRSTMRCPPARSARSRWRSRPSQEPDRRPDRCPDQDSCWRWTSGRPRCSSTRARASACRTSPWGPASSTRPTRCRASATSTRRSVTRCRTRSGTRSRSPSC